MGVVHVPGAVQEMLEPMSPAQWYNSVQLWLPFCVVSAVTV